MDAAALKTASQRSKDELRASLLSLTKACPVDECNPEDCPLYSLRKMEPMQRLQWLNALSEDDLVYLATYHHVCMNIKMASKSDASFS
jgi:hypothetical protein